MERTLFYPALRATVAIHMVLNNLRKGGTTVGNPNRKLKGYRREALLPAV